MDQRDSFWKFFSPKCPRFTNDFRRSCLFILSFSLLLQTNIDPCSAVTFHEQDIQGEVGGGNYSYYHLKNDFNGGSKTAAVVLLLFSVEGDADLYVSRSVEKPTYEHGEHDYQSTSCGIDRIDINLNAPILRYSNERIWSSKGKSHPLTVGVYGHPSQPISRYVLKVLLFVDDKPVAGVGQSDEWRLQDDEYMSDEMLLLASDYRWTDWVQQVQVADSNFGDVTASFPDSSTQGSPGEGFGQLLKATAEVLLAVISFALNILVEIMV